MGTSFLPPIYTIGYGNRTIYELIDILKQYNIEFLIDVRTSPYSFRKPEFSRDNLELSLKSERIRYVYMGDTLGGRPNDSSCYTDGRADYRKIQSKEFYSEGISRLKVAQEKQLRVALMCSECKPEECHRSKLIGQTLSDIKIEVLHIDENNRLKTQIKVIDLLTNRQMSLLDDPAISISRKIYDRRKQ